MQGPGSFIYEDGSFYIGSFYEGIRDGHGILFYTDGSVFKGIWAKGDIKGIGIYKKKNKDIVLGVFEENEFERPKVKDGPTQIKYKSGDVFFGKMENGQYEGEGCLVEHSTTCNTYQGKWKKGKKNGQGLLQFGTEDEEGRRCAYK